MIDRISLGTLHGIGASSRTQGDGPAAIATELASALSSGNPIGTPLREIAAAAAGELQSALGPAESRVAAASLEKATLDFGREVKALSIGRPDLSTDQRAQAIAEAIGAGASHAAALPETFNPIDRAISLFDHAASHLSEGRN